MNRLLRATVLPLLALLGSALLAWGVVGWWRFHRDLYVEEEAALQALADEVGSVRYRRAGELAPLRNLKNSSDEPEAVSPEVPWSVPFLGRVEYVDADFVDSYCGFLYSRTPSTQPIRDRVLSLPGLRGYRDIDSGRAQVDGVDARRVDLGRPLPEPSIPELNAEDLEAEFPDGQSLDPAATRDVAQRIETAWSVERPKRSRLVRLVQSRGDLRSDRTTHDLLLLVDGQNDLRIALGGPNYSPLGEDRLANAVLRSDQGLWELNLCDGQANVRKFARRDLPESRATQDVWSPDAFGPPAELKGFNYDSSDSLCGWLLGTSGEKIVRVDRVSDGSLRIESKGREAKESRPYAWRFRALVRDDMDFAIERWDFSTAHFESGQDFALKRREIRRLKSIDGEPSVVESLHDAIERTGNSFYDSDVRTHSLAAIEYDPAYSLAALDPASYGAKIPEPRTSTAFRSYRLASAAGIACFILAGVVGIVRACGRHRGAKSAIASRSERIRLRFGLVSLFAATLLVIGGAGWIKQHVDAIQDERALLSEGFAYDGGLRYARAKPAFPWAFVSTESFPIGAPLSVVTMSGSPPPGLIDRILARSPAIDLAIDEYDVTFDPPATWPEKELGRLLPSYGEVEPREIAEFVPIERGDPLPSSEANRVVADALAAWRRAREARPTKFAMRTSSSLRSTVDDVTVRDGDRYRAVRAREIWLQDESFRRRFVRFDDDWQLADHAAARDDPASFDERLVAGVFASGESAEFEKKDPLDYPAPEFFEGEVAIYLPAAPFALPAELQYLTQRLDLALLADEPRLTVVVERLSGERYRIEVERSFEERGDEYGPYDDPDELSVQAARCVMLVRPDLDWCVEQCDATEQRFATDTTPLDGYSSPPGSDPFAPATGADPFASAVGSDPFADRPPTVSVSVDRRREVRCRNTLKRIDGSVFAVDSQLMGSDWEEGDEPEWRFERVQVAVDLDPAIDDRLFSRPTLDSPDPTLPHENPPVTWCGVAFVLGAVTLAGQALRAMLARFGIRLGGPAVAKSSAAADVASGKDAA